MSQGECVGTCPKFVDSGNCTDSCASGHFVQENGSLKCVESCRLAVPSVFEGHVRCVDSCSTEAPFVDGRGLCVSLCPPELPIASEANHCIANCSSGTSDKMNYGIKFVGGARVCQKCVLWISVDGTRFCLDECPKSWVSKHSGECYQSVLKEGSTIWLIIGAGILVVLLFAAGYLVF